MPDGSSSAAPVITPGPSDVNSNRIHRAGANVGTKELERKFPMKQSANLFTTSHGTPCKSGAKVVECDHTSVLATFIMLHREEVRRPLQRPVQPPLTQVRYNNGNRIGCSIGAVFARRRGLGIPSLPRLARSQWQNVCTSAARTNKKGGWATAPPCPRRMAHYF